MSGTDDFLFDIKKIYKYGQNKTKKFENFVLKLKKNENKQHIHKKIVHSLNETN